ncbi:hypothetical protein F5B22DRAFT_612736 [Xylaria bambusicola]|uniref:uncharacterized protein n=1 Tax=Xylaria bambusicola TaxID=326684 RepID=UPI0020079E5C|nr:uncharacterized protein F5B22DRAFT_612736 [Xylaria bambusicola]KAI0513223.1 hypothetical protein F5B22DRAFT_612736 [Xylaria bambusicola]
MSSYSESEAVAKDFREALEDIQTIGRPEISNLTIIARENIEHALAISGALVDHIKKAAPHKKLPPLYVLDSIAKNVGTPYTLFFSRKLYQTYMDAYAMVDMATRRKLEEMLKTWKEPVPGSIDTRPVFAPDVVRPIENALIKVRTTALQQDQERMRSQQQLYGRGRPAQGVPYRETATPPGVRPPSQTHPYHAQQPPMQHGNGLYSQPAQPPAVSYPSQPSSLISTSRSTPQPPSSAFPPPHLGGYGLTQRGISIDALNDDIKRLTKAFQAQLAQSPHDLIIQTKLKALVDLQTILQTQNLPQEQLVLVKNQIADLAVNIRAPPAQTSTPVSLPNPVAVVPPPAPAAVPKVSLDSLFGSGALAAIMARNSATPQVPTPQPPPAAPVPIRSPPPQRVESQKVASAPADPMALMNMLRQAGMLPPATPATSTTPVPSTTPSATLPFPLPLPQMVKNTQIPLPGTIESLTSDILLKASSLKQFRPQLLPLLFEAQGPQCTQCGRRFPTTEEGKKRKTAHMDWHFRVNQRSNETEKRGLHRSWLVDEMDWINTRETIDKDHVVQTGDTDPTSGSAVAKAPKTQYIPVPDDPVLAASVCPICQDKFETRWLDDAQEFVWADAIKVGDRVYHASCHQEAFKDGGGPPPLYSAPMHARSTPEPVLGKRKAEDELVSLRGKLKAEAV